MALSTDRAISILPSMQTKILIPNQVQYLKCKNQFPFMFKQIRFDSVAEAGLNYHINSSLRSTPCEKNPYDANDSESDDVIIVEKTNLGEKEEHYDNETPQEVSLLDNLPFLNFLEDFDLQLDFEHTYSVLVIGGGGAVTFWIAAAVVAAIDSIPLFPKVLELIGLGYTVWFSSRYLLFKENRDELVARVEKIKQQVLGSKDN